MVEEDLDLTKTCPLCASPRVSTNRKGQVICRSCGNITPAGKVISPWIVSRIKSIFRRTKCMVRKQKKAKKKRLKWKVFSSRRKKQVKKQRREVRKRAK